MNLSKITNTTAVTGEVGVTSDLSGNRYEIFGKWELATVTTDGTVLGKLTDNPFFVPYVLPFTQTFSFATRAEKPNGGDPAVGLKINENAEILLEKAPGGSLPAGTEIFISVFYFRVPPQ